MADNELRDRLTRALTQDAALGGCERDHHLCVMHMAYLGPDDTHCARLMWLVETHLQIVRAEVADALNQAAKDVANINSDDSAHEFFRSLFAIRDWLRALAEEV